MNFVFFLYYLYIKKHQIDKHVEALSILQIGAELIILLFIMHNLGGISSVAPVFFFLPIIYSSFLFGMRGSVLTALASLVFINGLVLLEHFGIIQPVYFYSISLPELENLSIDLIKSITISLSFIMVGIYSGYGSNLLFSREESLSETSEQLKTKTNLLISREKKLSETNLRLEEEKKKINSIISNFTDPVIFLDNLGEISLFNPVTKEVLGFKDDIIGTVIPRKDNFSMLNFKKVIEPEFTIEKINDSQDTRIEEMTIKKEGQERTYKVMTEAVCDRADNCYGHIKVFYDLTREKKIDQMKSEFISIAAHQLRTPLSTIKWAIKMVLDGDTGDMNKEQSELLNKGYESNERIITLVNDMLNVSRIEADRLDYNFGMRDILPALERVIGELQNKIDKKKINFVLNKPADLPLVYCDDTKMILVFQGLLENAVKYTGEYGRIEVTLTPLKKFLQVSIKDNGVGIPKNDQDKMFTKFFRAQNVKRMQTEGSGLGLFIVKNIILRHKGEIDFKSREGSGTEFIFTIPLKKH